MRNLEPLISTTSYLFVINKEAIIAEMLKADIKLYMVS